MPEIHVRPGFWLTLSLGILVLPLPWLWALVLSSMLHECSHILALKIFHVKIRTMILHSGGAVLETGAMTPYQQLVSAVAGPIGPLITVAFARWMPRTALCALIQGIYHLLPLKPLDGGRALEGLTAYWGWTPWICTAAEWCVIAILVCCFIFFVWCEAGILPLMICGMVIIRAVREKYLANRSGNEYNRPTKP
jgi:Zn-dependent protease